MALTCSKQELLTNEVPALHHRLNVIISDWPIVWVAGNWKSAALVNVENCKIALSGGFVTGVINTMYIL